MEDFVGQTSREDSAARYGGKIIWEKCRQDNREISKFHIRGEGMSRRRAWFISPMVIASACFFTLLFSDSGGATTQGKPEPTMASTPKGTVWKYDYFDNFYDVSPVNSREIWIVGNSGKILHSGDEGKSWTIQVSGIKEDLYSASFIDVRRGWCAGSNGLILHTEDGGVTWARQTTGTTHPIFRIQFLSEKVGFACGYFGLILRTTDGGRTWENKSLGEDVALRGMSFLNEKTGFIVGEFGTMLKTADGGSSFTRLTSPVANTLFAIFFFDANSGYASGIDGCLLATIDGGRTWRKEDSGTKDHLIGIRSNGLFAVAVGLRGAVRVKAGGGKWVAVDGKTFNWLSGIYLDRDRKGLAVGAHGTIIRLEEILPKGKEK